MYIETGAAKRDKKKETMNLFNGISSCLFFAKTWNFNQDTTLKILVSALLSPVTEPQKQGTQRYIFFNPYYRNKLI